MKLPSFFSSPLHLTHRERIDKDVHTLTQAIQLKENKDDVSKKTLKLISHIFNRQGGTAPMTAPQVSTSMPASGEAASTGITASSTTSFVHLRARLQEGLDALNTTEMGEKAFTKLENKLYFLAGTAEGARAEWIKLYWEKFDSALDPEEQTGEAGLAAACLGATPDPSTMPATVNDLHLFDAFAILSNTGETSLPDEALATLDALFKRNYGLPSSLDPADYATYTDFPDPSNEEFRSIPTALSDLEDIQKAIDPLPADPIKRALQARADDFVARVQTAYEYFLGEAQKPVDAENPDDVQRRNMAYAWLGLTAIEDELDLASNQSDDGSEASSEASTSSTTSETNTEADDTESIYAGSIRSNRSSQPELLKRGATDPSPLPQLDDVLKSRASYARTSTAGESAPRHRTESEYVDEAAHQGKPRAVRFEEPEMDGVPAGLDNTHWNADRNDELNATPGHSSVSVHRWLEGQSEPRTSTSSLAGFDLPNTYEWKGGGVYFGSASGIINTRTMTLEQAFRTKLENRAVSPTTLEKLHSIFEKTSGIVLDNVHKPPKLGRAHFRDAYGKRFQNLVHSSKELARITQQVEQMPKGPARTALRETVASYSVHITAAQHWWQTRLEDLTSNPPQAGQTELQLTHELRTREARTWLGHPTNEK